MPTANGWVTDPAQVIAARDEFRDRVGRAGLTALVNNAGIASFGGDVSCEGCPIETQQRQKGLDDADRREVVGSHHPGG